MRPSGTWTFVLTWHKILSFQKFNADFDLSAKEGADSLAFISLIEEKLRPALVRLRVLSPLFSLNAGFKPSILFAL